MISSAAQFELARASVYSAFAFVQSSRLRLASSEISDSDEEAWSPGSRPWGTAQIRPSSKKSDSSRLALAFESEPWTMFSERSVGEVAPDRAGRGVGRIGRAHHRADARDRVLTADGEGEDRAGRDERDEVAEERLALVLGVVAAEPGPG